MPRFLEAGVVADLRALLEGHREHALVRQLVDYRRHDHVVAIGEQLAHAFHVPSLVRVVRLAGQHGAKLVEHTFDARHDDEPAQHGHDGTHDCQVASDQLLDAWVEHLHGHGAAVERHRTVHLGERCCC